MRLTYAACLILASPAVAQDGPSFDCSKASSGAEDMICTDAELARLDRVVSDRYAEALAAIRALDAGAAEAEDNLRAWQRGWLSARNECWKSEDMRLCIEDAYLRREGELVAEWMLEEPTATTFWTCDNSPANEVVTMFFDTELPSVRFERGDTIDTGVLVRTASGSKYEGSFGRSIWIKGDEALYREADPDGTEVTCTVSN